jgi:hypothetical protein
MKILNLGCGTKVSASADVINIDWSIQLRIKRNPIFRLFAPVLLNGARLDAYRGIPDNILIHDLSKGIPFPDRSIDVVFHSHTLEHLDRQVVPKFLCEVMRVLKCEGLHRIVVPDFEVMCTAYCDHLKKCLENDDEIRGHDAYVAAILEQSVRKEPYGSGRQRPVRRFIENFLLGDARHRGHTHQWMWDRFNLQHALNEAGFSEVTVRACNDSAIPNWSLYGLELDAGREYKPGSLYIEAKKK